MRRIVIVSLGLALVACGQNPEPAVPAVDAPVATDAGPASSREPLKDVIERTPQYLVGIAYPEVANAHPRLADALRGYAAKARADLDEAVKLAGEGGHLHGPYDLSLNFTELLNRPEVVAIAAEGSLYTGGAHGIPLIARFNYLPQEDRLLAPQDLIPDREGWEAISAHVRSQLREQVLARLAEDQLSDAERAEVIRTTGGMIDEGTGPDAGNFAQFEPIPAADGRWFGLRFVFPPYQVGPYSDGTQAVDVPVGVFRAHLAPKYRAMFTGG